MLREELTALEHRYNNQLEQHKPPLPRAGEGWGAGLWTDVPGNTEPVL